MERKRVKRIVTNIVELDKLYTEPCEPWKSLFRDGKVDENLKQKED